MAKKTNRIGFVGRIKERIGKVKAFFSRKSVQFVLGMLCFAFMIFLGSSFLSFFSSGGNDQSVVEAVSSAEVAVVDAAGNTSGKSGAVLANYFMNNCFGWASLLLLPLLLLVSLRLMQLRRIPLKRGSWIILYAMVWFSVLFDFLFGSVSGRCFRIVVMSGATRIWYSDSWKWCKCRCFCCRCLSCQCALAGCCPYSDYRIGYRFSFRLVSG